MMIVHSNDDYNRDKHNTKYQFVQDAVDAIIPLAGLGLLKADEGIVGLAG